MIAEEQPADAVLARRAAQGDDRAFATLVQRHKEPLYRLLRRYTGDPEEAQEAAHEAFIAAWGALKRYDAARPFGAWLRTIAINKVRDRGRRTVVRRLLFGARPFEESGALDKEDPAPSPDEALIDNEQVRAIDLAVSRLPAALRGPLLLTAFEGHTQQEAAAILGLSVKTVETRVYRARKILADTLPADLRPNS